MHQYLANTFRLIEGVMAGVEQAKRDGKKDDEIRQLFAAMNTVFSLFMTRNDRLVVP